MKFGRTGPEIVSKIGEPRNWCSSCFSSKPAKKGRLPPKQTSGELFLAGNVHFKGELCKQHLRCLCFVSFVWGGGEGEIHGSQESA